MNRGVAVVAVNYLIDLEISKLSVEGDTDTSTPHLFSEPVEMSESRTLSRDVGFCPLVELLLRSCGSAVADRRPSQFCICGEPLGEWTGLSPARSRRSQHVPSLLCEVI